MGAVFNFAIILGFCFITLTFCDEIQDGNQNTEEELPAETGLASTNFPAEIDQESTKPPMETEQESTKPPSEIEQEPATTEQDTSAKTYESEIYRPQKSLFEKMIADKKVYEIFFPVLQEIFARVNDTKTGISDPKEKKRVAKFLKQVSKSITVDFEEKKLAKELLFFQYTVAWMVPQIYDAIKFMAFPRLGQLNNIFAIASEAGFTDAINLILKNSRNSCAAYDELVVIASGSSNPLGDYIKSAYDPSLCQLSKETFAKWYQFFDQINPEYARYLFAQTYSNGLHVIQFAAVAKAYRPNVYEMHFKKAGNNYPVILSLYSAIKSTAFTEKEKMMLRSFVAHLTETFPTFEDRDGKESLTIKKVTQIVKKDPTFFDTFSKIPLQNNDGSFFDLILWISQKSTLQALFRKYHDEDVYTCC